MKNKRQQENGKKMNNIIKVEDRIAKIKFV
jgi:hypothetical protein